MAEGAREGTDNPGQPSRIFPVPWPAASVMSLIVPVLDSHGGNPSPSILVTFARKRPMMSFTAQRSMRFVSEAPAAGRDQAWLRFLTALLRALSVSVA